MNTSQTTHEQNDQIVTQLQGEIISLETKLSQAQQQIDWFKRQLFGRKSEKRLIDNTQQRSLFDNLMAEVVSAKEPITVTYERGKGKKDKSHSVNDSGLRFDETVPVKTIELIPDELKGDNASNYEVISHKISYRLAQQPASYVILKYIRPVLKHRTTASLITTPTAANVLENSMVDVSFLVGMLVDKFVYHCPLYRQHQKLQRNGIQISRGSLTQWAIRSIELLRPLYQAILEHILKSHTLAMDETPIKAGRKEKGRMRTAYFWPIYGDSDEIAFTYSSSRGQQHVVDTLGDFQGTLLTDGYAAYEAYSAKNAQVTLAQCWAHSRRYFEKSQNMEPQAVAEALHMIGLLYQIEADIRQKKLQGEKKLKSRTDRSLVVVDQFFSWCHQQRQRLDLINSNPLSKALQYVIKRESALRVFLTDPDVPIDTNHLERNLRPIPMGRKNWMFCWTELGAEHVGIIQSLCVTCQLHGVNPYVYLVDVLQRIDRYPASKVYDLTPRRWKVLFSQDPILSDLGDDRQ